MTDSTPTITPEELNSDLHSNWDKLTLEQKTGFKFLINKSCLDYNFLPFYAAQTAQQVTPEQYMIYKRQLVEKSYKILFSSFLLLYLMMTIIYEGHFPILNAICSIIFASFITIKKTNKRYTETTKLISILTILSPNTVNRLVEIHKTTAPLGLLTPNQLQEVKHIMQDIKKFSSDLTVNGYPTTTNNWGLYTNAGQASTPTPPTVPTNKPTPTVNQEVWITSRMTNIHNNVSLLKTFYQEDDFSSIEKLSEKADSTVKLYLGAQPSVKPLIKDQVEENLLEISEELEKLVEVKKTEAGVMLSNKLREITSDLRGENEHNSLNISSEE